MTAPMRPWLLPDLPVVLVSHRGPVSFRRDQTGARTASRGAGGLVTALTGLASSLPDAVWVCAATTNEDVAVAGGLAGLALWRRLDTARTYGWLLAAGYGLAFIYGLFAAGNRDLNFLSINGADNGLHLVSAVAGLAIALWPVDRTVPGRTADRST